jgi:diguanylate cyclase (GGDEF)-like protein/PAS domain S-box-containing protein
VPAAGSAAAQAPSERSRCTVSARSCVGCSRSSHRSSRLAAARERPLLSGLNQQVEGALQRFEQWFLSIGAIGFVLAILAGLVIAWRLSISLSRPLRQMSHAAEEFASGNLSYQLPAGGNDEVGRLARSLNRMARDLQKATRLLHRAQEIAAFGSWEWRPGRAAPQFSHGVYAILGMAPTTEALTLRDLTAFVVPEDRDCLVAVLTGDFDQSKACELRVERRDGALRTVLVKGESDYSDSGELIACFGTIQDITEQQQAQQQLAHLANFDTLTGLPNRNLFYDRLRHALHRAQRADRQVALFFLDLDRFKEINDGLGHGVGDALLRTAAQRLKRSVRESDTLARMGGDEFTLMIEDVATTASPSTVARKLIDALSAPFQLAERELFRAGCARRSGRCPDRAGGARAGVRLGDREHRRRRRSRPAARAAAGDGL